MAYYPRQAVWELTLKCNMNCMHCGSKAGRQKSNELTLDQCMDIASQLIDMGLEFITLMGGEVFFKKGWDKIARKFVDNGVYVNIITNGNGLGKEQYEQIKNSKIKQIGVSLDGLEKTHNKIRGNPNAFQEATKTLKNLYDMGYATEAITTISSLNIDDLEGMFDLLADLNVEIWQLQLCSPMGNAKSGENFLLDPKYVPYIIDFVVKKNKQKKVYVIAADNIGYFRWDSCPRDVSAITGACFLVRKEIFDKVKGFDEELFPINFNDVDLSLKILDSGYFISTFSL